MNEIDEIRSRLNIVDVISQYIKIEKAGVNFKARCPFHNEKTASFIISPQKQIWHCFGCAKGGDMFEFIKEIEGVEFYDALKILANQAGVELKKQDNKNWAQEKTERQKISEVLEQACKFFEHYLANSKKGTDVIAYLKKRGFTDEIIKSWRIGYAPLSYTALAKFLEQRGYAKQYIEKAGLSFVKNNGDLGDRFRSRIMFPFFDLNSSVIGFTGRIFEGDEDNAKYLNTPATLLYDKSKALFGIDKAKLEIRKKDQCILVEGNVDCILAQENGTKNVVAVSGTALTEIHLNILKRYTNNLTFSFDMDGAGKKATKRAIDLARKMGFNVNVIALEEGKDPADIISEKGKEAWEALVLKPEPIMDFYFRVAFQNKNIENVKDKKEITQELLSEIKKIENSIEQTHFIQLLSEKLNAREQDIREELAKVKLDKREDVEKEVLLPIETNREKLYKKFLKLYLLFPKKVDIKENLYLFSEKYSKILEELENGAKIEDVIKDKKFLSEILLGQEREKRILKENEVTEEQEIENCVYVLKNIIYKEQKNILTTKIKNEKDLNKKEKLIESYLTLINKNYAKNS